MVALFALTQFAPAFAQEKGDVYLYWGWNRGHYTNSDIRFLGSNYDFTLNNVVAHDRQNPFGSVYFKLNEITIPQYNFRLGYYINDKWSVSFGIDHMKYVMDQNQTVKMNGFINTGSKFDGQFTNHDQVLTEDFLTFEHTDGLNYVNFEARRHHTLWHFPISKNKKGISINVLGGAGAGFLYPRTDTQLLGQERHDKFHISGYGLSAVAGLNVTFWKYFFIQSEVKGGYINMPDIRTTFTPGDKAKQDFGFLQNNILFGTNIPLFNTKKK